MTRIINDVIHPYGAGIRLMSRAELEELLNTPPDSLITDGFNSLMRSMRQTKEETAYKVLTRTK